jgi:starch phosphorylase
MNKNIGHPVPNQHKPGLDSESLKRSLADRLSYTMGKDAYTATTRDWFHAAAYAVRDRLIDRWLATMRSYYADDTKRVYYLSMEFLIGRTLMNSVLNLKIDEEFRQALEESGLDLNEIREIEHDAALGNGGLGRLAACFLDSMATLNLPGYGYGIRYEYGMFTQRIEDGQQVEHPDNWLRYGNPWEFPRPEILYQVKFYGRWVDTEDVMAMAYDTPIPGYATETTNNMRLWVAKATRDFDLQYFNQGSYIKAVEDKNESENLSKVLYPVDTTEKGRELRLKQQYFFVCATLQDILYRYGKQHDTFDEFPDKVAIHLNDTHPSIAIPELMRILIDQHHMDWEPAWEITTRTFAYTNHTLLPEALEAWPIKLFERVLPRHLQIIYEINQRLMKNVMHLCPGDDDLLKRISIIEEGNGRRVRMTHVAIMGSHKVNGVTQLHTELMKQNIFSDFYRFWPEKFINITNGITPRRWLHQANPDLSALITSHIGDAWIKDLMQLKKLGPLAAIPDFRQKFAAIKLANKERLALLLSRHCHVEVDPESLFDVQIKRIHEYKRQLMNVLHVITRYNRIKADPDAPIVPRTVIFGGKAAPGYDMAKLIIRLINDVSDIVNNDPAVAGKLKAVFIPNYDVSTAEDIIPAADLSEQISTAGKEASGTGNMKLALNGALTIGTLDGATIEIMKEVGEENIFIFGLTTNGIRDLKEKGYDPMEYYHGNAELRQVLDMIGNGFFSPDQRDRYRPIIDSLLYQGDQYFLLADYASYLDCQKKVDEHFLDRDQWTRKAILNVANMGKFSSDRTVSEYASEIWNVKPVAS